VPECHIAFHSIALDDQMKYLSVLPLIYRPMSLVVPTALAADIGHDGHNA
jgi:hypothetical protein